jgi:NAD(P)-dependent dehydrogenase (short-subunit alcohol dehydrogenase family)
MAVGLARAGAEVVLGGRIPEKAERRLAEIHSHGGKGYFVPVDVTSRESLQHLLDTVLERRRSKARSWDTPRSPKPQRWVAPTSSRVKRSWSS